MAKLVELVEETHLREEAEKVKINLAIELATLRDQMDKAKVDAVAEFQLSQPFFDTCSVYYGDRFNNCLKQVGAVYPDLDLSQIVIDDIVLQTLGGDDAISNETDDSAHTVE